MSNTWLGRERQRLLAAVARLLARWRRFRGPIAAMLVALAGLIGTSVAADHGTDGAPVAARRLQDARDRAATASDAVVDAQARIALLTIDVVAAEQRLAEARLRLGAESETLEAQLGSLVFNGAASLATLIEGEPTDEANEVLPDRSSDEVVLDEGDPAAELEFAQRELDALKDYVEAARREIVTLAAEAEDAIAKLADVEAHHLADPAVELELELLELERQDRPTDDVASAVAVVAARAADTHVVSDGPMLCPIAGEHTFVNTFGAPRSGGRRHQGLDMMSSRDTPIVAVESGSANFKTNRLGGRSIWLTGNSGTTYYYAHLSDWEGSSRPVVQGEVIGYVGMTGNAYSPHLHFEIHPDGGGAVSPFRSVDAAC